MSLEMMCDAAVESFRRMLDFLSKVSSAVTYLDLDGTRVLFHKQVRPCVRSVCV